MNKRAKLLIIGLAVLLLICAVIIIVLVVNSSKTNNTYPIPPKPIPNTTTNPVLNDPVSLIGNAQSSRSIVLTWEDNSLSESGFILYRNNAEIVRTAPNTTLFVDSGLSPATTYNYTIKAFNETNESGAATCTIKTLNPGINVRLDKIGVYDNRENTLRGEGGEVYIYAVVSDGENPVQKTRFPSAVDQDYKMAKNETIDIHGTLFAASEVGDRLTITFIGYENDGEDFEPYVYKALELAIEAQMGGTAGALLEIFNVDLSGLIGQFLGEQDDWLGSYERTWDISNNWGYGTYEDITCQDENGVNCLRLWFTIIIE